MIDLDIRTCYEHDPRRKYVADGPINFDTWLQLALERDTELIRGVIVDRMSAQFPHEWIFAWLFSVLRSFVGNRKLGVVLGSRTAVKISENDGRLPDILFVRAENSSIIHKDAIYGVPDLVIEIVSENDYPHDLIPLETDYRDLGVPEIVFIDPKKRGVRYLQKNDDQYDAVFLTEGHLEFGCIPDFWVEVSWLFAEEKPDEFTVTRQLIEAADSPSISTTPQIP